LLWGQVKIPIVAEGEIGNGSCVKVHSHYYIVAHFSDGLGWGSVVSGLLMSGLWLKVESVLPERERKGDILG